MRPGNRLGFQLYLASNSLRRRELLSLIDLEYHLLTSQVDETPRPDEDGAEYVKRIARSKALAAANLAGVNGMVMAADTTVLDRRNDGKSEIYGKPRDPGEAVAMLQALRGHTHRVLTALAIVRAQDGTIQFDSCTTDVPMRNYSDSEIHAYVATGDPMDKAGAYAIQHSGFHPVEDLRGCFANVMGLPLCHLTRSLRQMGIPPRTDVPKACQAGIGYNCSVYSRILQEKPQELSFI